MSLINILEPNFEFQDERGSLVQLIRDGFKQVNIINSRGGAIRGGHYHIKNREAFYVVKGKMILETWDITEPKVKEKYEFNTGDMFEIPPFVAHDFTFLIDTLLVSMYSEGVELENGKKDIISV